VLARSVIVEALAPGAPEDARQAFAVSAAAAGRLVHPGVVATYDSGLADDVPYIVTERPAGPTLAELLARQGPMPAARVVTIGRQLARALEASHRLGVVHGAVSPATVLVGDDDRIKLARFAACGAACRLAGGVPASIDVRDAARTLVAALTGGQPVVSARAVQPGVPRPLDDVLVAFGRDGGDAADLASALEELDVGDDAMPLVERDPTPWLGTPVRPPPVSVPGARSGAVAGVVVGLLLAVALAVAAVIVNGGGGGPVPPQPPGAAQGRGGSLPLIGAASFNPLGSGPEHASEVGYLTDNDPATSWTTETYSSRNFGGLKSGDGVVVTLAGTRTMHQLTVWSSSRGWTFSVYVAAHPADTLAGWGAPVGPPVTVQADVTQVDLGGRSGGAVLVWITALPPSPPYQVRVGELALR
jgi:serine/threonine protein kinase